MVLTLDAAKWRRKRGIKRVLLALRADEGLTRYVGGAVRDDLLGLPVNDIDLATRIPPEEVIERLKKAKIKAVPTGIDHGTVTAVSDGHPFEITTLRRDVSTDGRRATVAFTDDWEEDAARRDFTINALSADPMTGKHSARIAKLALQNRLPAIGGVRQFAIDGGLMTYGADFVEGWRLAARYVHRILQGAKPADLPVEQPTAFELAVNTRTAQALGLTLPASLLVRAEIV